MQPKKEFPQSLSFVEIDQIRCCLHHAVVNGQAARLIPCVEIDLASVAPS
jgi:hypothetical protein